MFNNKNRYDLGYELFSLMNRLYEEDNIFTNTKAYLIYFAYHIKNYEGDAGKILNTFFIELKSTAYKNSYDFCMMNFYKGLIFLLLGVILI
jgi:hypothetical protein